MLRRIEAEFALILFMLAEMPVLVLSMLAEMAFWFMLMLIMFAWVISLFMLMDIMLAEAIMSRTEISSELSLTLMSRALRSSSTSSMPVSLRLTRCLRDETSPWIDAMEDSAVSTLFLRSALSLRRKLRSLCIRAEVCALS